MKKGLWKVFILSILGVCVSDRGTLALPISQSDYASENVNSWGFTDQLAVDLIALKGGLFWKISSSYVNDNKNKTTSLTTHDTSIEHLITAGDPGNDNTSQSLETILISAPDAAENGTTNSIDGGQTSPVPEPASLLIFGIGLVGVGLCGKYKRLQ